MHFPPKIPATTLTLSEVAANVQRFYPHAHTANAQLSYLINILTQHYGVVQTNILYAQSVCADDVNAIKFPPVLETILGPFGLGGLDGYPFTGVSGMQAYADHVPDAEQHGAALIFCGPHIGVSDSGELGKMQRHGQQHDSKACGAAYGVLSWLREHDTLPPESADDRQMHLLKSLALHHRARILAPGYNSTRQLYELTEVFYEEIWRKVVQYVKEARFKCRYVFVAGGVLINTSRLFDDYLSLRHFEVYEGPSEALVKSYTLLPELVTW